MVTLLLLIGCATTGTMRNASLDEGVSRTFIASFDRVLKAARESVTQSGLKLDDINQLDNQTWIIIGKKEASEWSWGEFVRVTVQKKRDSVTLVRVLSKKKLTTNITARDDYSQLILSNIDINLK